MGNRLIHTKLSNKLKICFDSILVIAVYKIRPSRCIFLLQCNHGNHTRASLTCWTHFSGWVFLWIWGLFFPVQYICPELGCHGVNINTEYRHREKKTGFTECTENTTLYKTPCASLYHWLYTIPYEVAISIYCVFISYPCFCCSESRQYSAISDSDNEIFYSDIEISNPNLFP